MRRRGSATRPTAAADREPHGLYIGCMYFEPHSWLSLNCALFLRSILLCNCIQPARRTLVRRRAAAAGLALLLANEMAGCCML